MRGRGVSVGIVARGGIAIGIFAFGGVAIGLVACGGLAIGVVALGGGALGLLAVGGAAVGGYTVGSISIGLIHAIGALTVTPEGSSQTLGVLRWASLAGVFVPVRSKRPPSGALTSPDHLSGAGSPGKRTRSLG